MAQAVTCYACNTKSMEVTQGMGQGETIRWIAIGEGGGAGGRRRTDTHMPGMMGDQRDKAALTYIKVLGVKNSGSRMRSTPFCRRGYLGKGRGRGMIANRERKWGGNCFSTTSG